MKDELDYYKEKANRLEKEKNSNEQISGCFTLIFVVIGLFILLFL